MKIVTSNINKLKEFNRFGLPYDSEGGIDLPEVDGTIDDVIIYKSLSAGVNKIVEDTILEVDGEEIIDIRWKIKEMNKNSDAKWIVSLGLNDGTYIKVYRGITNGKLIKTDELSSFGFDNYFLPDGSDLTLGELEKIGRKDDFSSRKIACLDLVNDVPILIIKISQIPNWTGKYQH